MHSEISAVVAQSRCAQEVMRDTGARPPRDVANGDRYRLAFGMRTSSGHQYTYTINALTESGELERGIRGTITTTPARYRNDPLLWYCECNARGYALLGALALKEREHETLIFRNDRVIGLMQKTYIPVPPTRWNWLWSWLGVGTRHYEVTCGARPFGRFEIRYPHCDTSAIFWLQRPGLPELPIVGSCSANLSGEFGDLPLDLVLPVRHPSLDQDELDTWFMINVVCRIRILQLDFSS